MRLRRPLVASPYLGAWIVLLASSVIGLRVLGVSLWPPGFEPSSRLGLNSDVYYFAAEAFLAGEDFYAVTPPGAADMYTYLYPPVTIVAFVPYTLFDASQAYLLHTVISVLGCTVATVAIVSYLEGFDLVLGWFDIALIWLFFVGSTHSTGTINFGNVNLWLAVGLALGFVLLERGRDTIAGGLFGLVALMKVFPALVGLYLLRIRSWRGVGGAILTGGGGLALSALIFGTDTVRQFFEILLDRSESAAFVGGYPPDETYYVTIQRPLSHLLWEVWPSAPEHALPIVAALVLAPIVGYTYLDLETRTDRLVAIHATLTATVVLMPALRWYLALLFFSWVSLLYVFHARLVQIPFVVGGLVAAVTNSPSVMLARVESYPPLLAAVAEPLYAVGTMQLYGMLIMLGACVLYKAQNGVGVTELRRSIDAARTDFEKGLQTVRSKVIR